MKKAIFVIRIILSLGLIYLVYKETGIFTTIAISLMILKSEIDSATIKRLIR